MSTRENTPSPMWTYRVEASQSGSSPTPGTPQGNDPIALLHVLINLQSQTLELQRQSLEQERQILELTRENTQVAREQRARQVADLERWQGSHEGVIDNCKDALSKLEAVHASLMRDMSEYVDDHHENLVDGDFALSDFVDKFGPKLAHVNTMLAVLRPLALNLRRTEG